MEELLKEQQKTNELLEKLVNHDKEQNELLTIKQIVKEFKIGENTVSKQFKDPELPVQIYTHPMKVTRKAYQEYFDKRHDYLSSK